MRVPAQGAEKEPLAPRLGPDLGVVNPRGYDSPDLRGGRLAGISDFFAELKRRRVVRSLLAWGVLAFAVLQVYEPVMHGLHLPEWTLTLVVILVAAGFPVTVVLAWIFDIGPGGIQRTSPLPGVEGASGPVTLFPASHPTRIGPVRPGHLEPAGSRVILQRVRGDVHPPEAQFRGTFMVGRSPGCDVRVTEEFVSRQHLKVGFDGERWWLKDLGSGSGTFVEGSRIGELPLEGRVEVELGPGGPRFSLTAVPDVRARPAVTGIQPRGFTSETQIIERYVGQDPGAPAGSQTLMFRRAFERVQRSSSRKYRVAIAVALAGLLLAAAAILYQARKLDALHGQSGTSSRR